MELVRCYKYTMAEFLNLLKAFSKEIKQECAWQIENQKIKLEGDTPIAFNEFARYMVSIECDDHIVYHDADDKTYVLIFGHRYK